MAKVLEGLAKRKREREQNQGWFESWLSTSPWLVTLISTLLGPLIIILLLLTFWTLYFKQISCLHTKLLSASSAIHNGSYSSL